MHLCQWVGDHTDLMAVGKVSEIWEYMSVELLIVNKNNNPSRDEKILSKQLELL